MPRLLISVIFAICLLPAAVLAEELPPVETLPDAPPPPPQVESGETLEPQVTIRRTDEAAIAEYRVKGRLYMVKVTPNRGGPSYYLIDTDGDGELDTKRHQLDPDFNVSMWKLFSW